MLRHLDLLDIRYLQITLAMLIFAAIDKFAHIPHSSWIVISGIMVYNGFNPGTVIKRAYLRFIGTIIGVAAVAIIWYLIHLNYRLLIPGTILIMWAMMYFAALPYNRFMIIATIFSDIILEWSNTATFSLQYYVVDRVICVLIVFAICIILEQICFGKSNLSYLNFMQTKQQIIKELEQLFHDTNKGCLSKAKLLKQSNLTLQKLERLLLLAKDSKYEGSSQIKTQNLQQLAINIRNIQRKISGFIYLKNYKLNHKKEELLRQTIQDDLSKLNLLA